MAITKILNIQESDGRNPASHLKNALEYIQNPDKVTDYVKENELDKKAKSMADEFGDAMKSVGKSLEDTFSNIVGKK